MRIAPLNGLVLCLPARGVTGYEVAGSSGELFITELNGVTIELNCRAS